MARQELSQTNVFHQTAVWAALHKGIEAGGRRRTNGMCAGGKLEAEPRGIQSERLRPPPPRPSHRGLRCALRELIPPKPDCLCWSNQGSVMTAPESRRARTQPLVTFHLPRRPIAIKHFLALKRQHKKKRSWFQQMSTRPAQTSSSNNITSIIRAGSGSCTSCHLTQTHANIHHK